MNKELTLNCEPSSKSARARRITTSAEKAAGDKAQAKFYTKLESFKATPRSCWNKHQVLGYFRSFFNFNIAPDEKDSYQDHVQILHVNKLQNAFARATNGVPAKSTNGNVKEINLELFVKFIEFEARRLSSKKIKVNTIKLVKPEHIGEFLKTVSEVQEQEKEEDMSKMKSLDLELKNNNEVISKIQKNLEENNEILKSILNRLDNLESRVSKLEKAKENSNNKVEQTLWNKGVSELAEEHKETILNVLATQKVETNKVQEQLQLSSSTISDEAKKLFLERQLKAKKAKAELLRLQKESDAQAEICLTPFEDEDDDFFGKEQVSEFWSTK